MLASPSLGAEALHFLGEVEVVFGLWAVVLVATTAYAGWEAARHYVSETVNYTEPLFVVVIMALASTRPVIGFAESALRRVAAAGGGTPAAWWAAILTIGPVLGSFITEPAAMTI
jgi:Putative Na+/H+ antiporter